MNIQSSCASVRRGDGGAGVFMEVLPIGVEVHLNFHYSLAARPDGRSY